MALKKRKRKMIDQDILKYRERIFILSTLAAFTLLHFSVLPAAVGWIESASPWVGEALRYNDAVKMFITLPIICALAYPSGLFLSQLIMAGLPTGKDT